MIVQKRLADYLRTERKELKESYVAEKAEIKQSRFSLLMNCHREMKADELLSIIWVLDLKPKDILGLLRKTE